MPQKFREAIKQTIPFVSLEEVVYLNILFTAQSLQEPWERYLKTEAHISPSGYNLLRILRGSTDSGRTCTEISERMINRDPDVTRLVDRLAKRNLVRRSKDTEDRRIVRVFITEPGLQLLETLDSAADKYSAATLNHLDKELLEKLRDLLDSARDGARVESA